VAEVVGLNCHSMSFLLLSSDRERRCLSLGVGQGRRRSALPLRSPPSQVVRHHRQVMGLIDSLGYEALDTVQPQTIRRE